MIYRQCGVGVVGIVLFLAATTVVWGQTQTVTDWPQWRGPNRDGISEESGLLSQWPESGPARLW